MAANLRNTATGASVGASGEGASRDCLSAALEAPAAPCGDGDVLTRAAVIIWSFARAKSSASLIFAEACTEAHGECIEFIECIECIECMLLWLLGDSTLDILEWRGRIVRWTNATGGQNIQ